MTQLIYEHSHRHFIRIECKQWRDTVSKRSWYEPAHTQTAIEYKWHQVIELQHQQWKRNKASLSRNHHSLQTHTQTHRPYSYNETTIAVPSHVSTNNRQNAPISISHTLFISFGVLFFCPVCVRVFFLVFSFTSLSHWCSFCSSDLFAWPSFIRFSNCLLLSSAHSPEQYLLHVNCVCVCFWKERNRIEEKERKAHSSRGRASERIRWTKRQKASRARVAFLRRNEIFAFSIDDHLVFSSSFMDSINWSRNQVICLRM